MGRLENASLENGQELDEMASQRDTTTGSVPIAPARPKELLQITLWQSYLF